MCLIVRMERDIEYGSLKLKKNHGFVEREGIINIIEQVNFTISSNHYNLEDCEPHKYEITKTCIDFLSRYNKALNEKILATQELYHFKVRLENKKLKVTMLEKGLLL